MADRPDHADLITTSYWTFGSGDRAGVSHLVAERPDGGTPGPTLCGIDRFAKGGPGGGWHPSRRNLYNVEAPVCPVCVDALRQRVRTYVERVTLQLAAIIAVHDDVQFDTPEDTAAQRRAVDQALDALGWDRAQLAAHVERLRAASQAQAS